MSMPEAIDAAHISQARSHPSSTIPPEPGYELLDLNNVQEAVSLSGTNRSKTRIFAILVGLYLSLFIAALDQTIVATAIPTISADLHSSTGFVWIGGAYLLANAAGGPIWAALSDIWGRKPVLLIVVVWFFVASTACATAKSMNSLIASRALQGVAGGGLIQLVNITLSDVFSERSRSLYYGLLEMMWCIAGGSGPLLGGLFASRFSWRLIFWLNLPICGLTFLLLLFFLDVHNPRTPAIAGLKAIDWAGSLAILGMTVMLLLGLNFGGVVFAWSSPKVVVLLVVGAAMSGLFVLAEKKLAKYPLMPMRIFNDRSNLAALVVTFFHGIVFLGSEYYLPLYFQSARLADPLKSGALVLPFTVTEALGGIASGLVMHAFRGYKMLIVVGMVLLTAGIGLYINLSRTSPLAHIIGYQILAGFGAGFVFSPPILAIQARVAQQDVGSATATLGFVRNLGTAMSAVMGGVIFTNEIVGKKIFLQAAGLNATEVATFAGHAAEANVLQISGLVNEGHRHAVQDAYADSLRTCWIMYTCVAGAGMLAAVFIRESVLRTEHVETKTGLRVDDKEGESERTA